MDHFNLRHGVAHCEDVPLPVIAEAVGTPVHVYSAAALRDAAHRFKSALAVLPRVRVAFAVKANPNGAVLHLLAGCGFGADIVSGGEMGRALDAGIAASDIVFSGVGKTDRELADALLEALPLVAEGELGAFATAGLGDAVGDRPVRKDPGDQEAFAGEKSHARRPGGRRRRGGDSGMRIGRLPGT